MDPEDIKTSATAVQATADEKVASPQLVVQECSECIDIHCGTCCTHWKIQTDIEHVQKLRQYLLQLTAYNSTQ